MQTFLVYPDYLESVEVLDQDRLGNQCWREVLTILNGGWWYHPVSKMWRDYPYSLCEYGIMAAHELISRPKYKKAGTKWLAYYKNRQQEFQDTGYPWWLGDERLHASHRSNLLRKDFDYYSQFGWEEHPYLPYWWPV